MRIAVLGTGSIGTTLAGPFAAAHHDVIYGAKNPSSTPVTDNGVPVTSIPAAVEDAEIVVLAVPGAAVAAIVKPLRAALEGVLVIDATNRMDGGPANSRDALADVPGARYARAFNSVGVDTLREPTIDGIPVDMLYACATSDRPVVASLIKSVGPRPVWAGEDGWDACDAGLGLWLGLARTYGRHIGLRILSDTLTQP